MSLLPDPGHLYATADRIARHAEALRTRAGLLCAAAFRAHWHSAAAAAFRAEAEGLARQMRHAAARIDDAADALRRHARRLENELSWVSRGAVAIEHGVESAVGDLVDGARGVAHAAGQVLDAFGLG